MKTKQFSLRTLLTVTTGRLLTEPKGEKDNGIADLYEVLDWMTSDSGFTHQLGRFDEECKPWLLRWFSEFGLAEACLDKLDQWISRTRDKPDAPVDAWLAELQLLFPGKFHAYYDVPRIPQDDHERKHPWDELVAIRGTDEGIIPIEVGNSPTG